MIGRSVNTLQKWDRKGVLNAHRSPTNRRYYIHDPYLAYRGLLAQESGKVIVYARVSSAGHKPDLANQVAALHAYCIARSSMTGGSTALCGCLPTRVSMLGSGLRLSKSGTRPRSAAGVTSGKTCPCGSGRIAVGTQTVGWCWIAT
jgi:hypothetical protein